MGGVLKRQARRPRFYTHTFIGLSILRSAPVVPNLLNEGNQPERPSSALLHQRLSHDPQPARSQAREAPTLHGRKERGGASRLGAGSERAGGGERGADSFRAKSKRRAQGCLPRFSLLAVPPALLIWESRPPAQVGSAL